MIKCYPDSLEEELFKIYILYLEGVITDLSRLNKLTDFARQGYSKIWI